MNILLVAQCNKQALTETRRVIDQFAERKGQRTWQTSITQEGMLCLKKMLRQSARRNTAVACHWLKKSGHSELLWTVGRRSAFDENGNVPTNRSRQRHLKNRHENTWQSGEVIALAAAIAGLFHDFGKANLLFQNKLKGRAQGSSEPFRHEWVSLRLFAAFLAGCSSDKAWLARLNTVCATDEQRVLEALVKDELPAQNAAPSIAPLPFTALPPFAALVAWLIVSHHRLPLRKQKLTNFKEADTWLDLVNHGWNSDNFSKGWSEEELQAVWHFPAGTPIRSAVWCKKAREIAKRALACQALQPGQQAQPVTWLQQRFTSHLARLSLMLADHVYSALPAEESKQRWRDPHYSAFANTDRKAKTQRNPLKQKLDEHNIGVAHNALLFARNLPLLRRGLAGIDRHKALSKRAKHKKFAWQDKAYDTAQSLAEASSHSGFFGINMASTGCGKTFANARIMYGLSGGKQCRFSVALGLRTLTLQTGDAYRAMLQLSDDDMAVLIGSQAVRELHQLKNREEQSSNTPVLGSDSGEDFCEHMYVSYAGEIYDGRLKQWLSPNKKLNQLISAPITVSTIDHLMPATESLRGGKQIAPMLRLLTADLVLDEPDDFGLEDLPALCRLVNWAGMLGSRVLLSSATLPPAMVCAAFDAYCEGRKQYNAVHSSENRDPGICCAWFDEFSSTRYRCRERSDVKQQHRQFVAQRVKQLEKTTAVLRRGKLLPISQDNQQSLASQYAQQLLVHIQALHRQFSQTHSSGAKVSLGVVRMANINPLVAVAKALVQQSPQANVQLHYCVYHSQFPLAMRSFMEKSLDKALQRHDEQQLWQQPEIRKALSNAKADNHIFVVLGTSVVEVGRDHDYDWAIAEPSSLRSLIQLAGRIQRHRQQPTQAANLLVFSKNINALQQKTPAYCRPGFETKALPLAANDLQQLLSDEIAHINALPRIREPEATANYVHAGPAPSFVIQEHRALISQLFTAEVAAQHWWQQNLHWNAELIRQTPFRKSQPQETFVLRWPEDEALQWANIKENTWPPQWCTQNNRFQQQTTALAPGVNWWFELEPQQVYSHYAAALNKTEQQVADDFGTIQLRAATESQQLLWHWHPMLGVFQEFDK